MEDLLDLLAPFIGYWRTLLVTVVALVVAVFLALTFAPFTGAYGIGLVLLAFGAGMLWDADSQSKGKK